MKKTYLLASVLFFVFIFSCKKEKEKSIVTSGIKEENVKQQSKLLKEEAYVLNGNYPIGDVRRYGVFPDSSYTNVHPISKKPKIVTAIDIAEEHKIELFFPKGYYKTALILDSRKNMNLKFNQAEFDLVHITQVKKGDDRPENLRLKGSMIVYDRLGITEAINIQIDTVFIKSDTIKNLRKMRSRGCHIYHGCKDIGIKYLSIEDFGSGDDRYKNNHASLALDGWRNNPENVHIEKLYIKSTDRHGIYLTGTGHKIDEIVIDQFGIGSDKGMSSMQDASVLEHKLFSAMWINRCYDSSIGNVTINAKNSKGYFSTNFDEGDSLRPVKIHKMTIKNFDRTLPVRFAKNTGVIVEEMIK